MGRCYQNGVGVPKDRKEAAKWYRLAVAQGHEAAKENLDDCTGVGTAKRVLGVAAALAGAVLVGVAKVAVAAADAGVLSPPGQGGGGGGGSQLPSGSTSSGYPGISESHCNSCGGKGFQNLGTPNERRCPSCGGQGVTRTGFSKDFWVCDSCGGKGWQNFGTSNERRCPSCGGQGLVRRN